jgi:hypothetical protein
MHITIARQRLDENIPETMLSTSVAGYRTNKHAAITIRDKNGRCFLCDPRRVCLLGNCVVTRFYKNTGAVFSVLRGPCRDYIRETM